MKPISAHKKFCSLTVREIQAALRDKKVNTVKQEFYRLVDGYASILEEGNEKYANAIETLLHVTKRPLIETAAIEYAAMLIDIAQSATAEARIPPDTLRLIGKTAFGKQWQTPLAKTLQVADRTMRRWTDEGAPFRICRELFSILSDREESIRQARSLLAGILKHPKLRLVKS